MKIGVIGAGRMAGALGTRFAAAGHQLMIGARKPDAAASLATTIGKGTAHGDITSIRDPVGCDAEQGRWLLEQLGGTQIVREEGPSATGTTPIRPPNCSSA